MVSFSQLSPWRRIVVLGAKGAGKTTTLVEAAHGRADVAGFVQVADRVRDAYTLVNLRGGAQRRIAWRSEHGMQFDDAAFAAAATWLGAGEVLVLDEIGKLEAEGEGHAEALAAALVRPAHVVCAVRADRWEPIRARFGLHDAVELAAGDVRGVRALLESEFALARLDELDALQEIERRADQRFAEVGHPELADGTTMPRAEAIRVTERDRLLVARRAGAPVGFAVLGLLDDEPCLGQISVDPAHGRSGIGTALLRLTQAALRQAGARSLVLSTQADVSWNRPWYERHGFVSLPEDAWTPAMHRLAAAHSAAGLDTTSRVFMRCALGRLPHGTA